MPKFRAYEIVWDTNGEGVELPFEVVVECEDEEQIANELSDTYGWLIESMRVEHKE